MAPQTSAFPQYTQVARIAAAAFALTIAAVTISKGVHQSKVETHTSSSHRRLSFEAFDPKTITPREANYEPATVVNVDAFEQQTHNAYGIVQNGGSRFATSAMKCGEGVIDVSAINKRDWHSQDTEDQILMKWFHTLCEGTYIEMGALDGVQFSNSYVFNKHRGWKGVMIELFKHNYEKLIVNRPNEIANIHAGVCDVPQTLHYFANDKNLGAVGGIYEFSSPTFREQWWKGVSMDDPRVHEMQCDTLDSLLRQYTPEVRYFDFFSLDVEGAELSVLESIDFDRVGFGIVFAEADAHNELKNMATRALLESKGYSFLQEVDRSYWFVNKDFHAIYRHLIYGD